MEDSTATPLGSTEQAIKYAASSLQSQESLAWLMKQNEENFSDQARDKSHSVLDDLRALKANLEGSDRDFVPVSLMEDGLVELKQLTLMHVPGSVTEEVCEKFRTKVETVLKGHCKSIESITLLTCPWYESSQKERGEQAKHNILQVVFTSFDRQFFSPVNYQVKDKGGVIDLGWLSTIELSHFGQALARGRTRYIETIFCRDGAEVFASDNWKDLRNILTFQMATDSKAFLEASLGQAVGGISKKKKNGGMKLREGATIFEICESLRLARLAEDSLRGQGNNQEISGQGLTPKAADALTMVQSFYDSSEPVKFKVDLFNLLMEWVAEIRALAPKGKAAKGQSSRSQEVEKVIGHWLMRLRLNGNEIRPHPALTDSHSKLLSMMQDAGGPVARIRPDQVLLMTVAGSAMYNLNTPSSDVDYLIVYAHATEEILSSTKRLTECHESRGLEKDIEYGAYEARMFCEMLLKCSVVILELLFTDAHEYTSPLWQELSQHKQKFVTEKGVQQYLGLIKNNFRTISRGKLSDSPKRDRKLFYQNFHKINSLLAMMNGSVPDVRVDGDVREFIMNVRTKDDGDWTRDKVWEEADRRYKDLMEKLCTRTTRLKENPPYELCTDWLMSVRGL